MTQLHTFTPPDDTDDEDDDPIIKITFGGDSTAQKIDSVELDSEPVTVNPITGTFGPINDEEADQQER